MSAGETVEQVMEKNVETVELNSSAKDAASAMGKRGVGCVVIVSGGRAVGIVTERDLVSKVIGDGLEPAKVLVRDIMSTPLITVHRTASITQVAELMNEYTVRRLVVTDEAGELVGIVTAADLARTLAKRGDFNDPALNAIARLKESPAFGPYQ